MDGCAREGIQGTVGRCRRAGKRKPIKEGRVEWDDFKAECVRTAAQRATVNEIVSIVFPHRGVVSFFPRAGVN